MSQSPVDFNRSLTNVTNGDREAAAELFPILYDELRRFAVKCIGPTGGAKHTLQPTALVHEAFLKLINQTSVTWQNRAHFLALSSVIMRQVLVDHARRGQAGKRGGNWRRITLDQAACDSTSMEIDVIALDEALKRLAQLNPRHAQMVELRFLGGLTVEETALVLDVSPRTVKSDWRLAKAWLSRELRKGEDP